jgi:hypothetical protein
MLKSNIGWASRSFFTGIFSNRFENLDELFAKHERMAMPPFCIPFKSA